MLFSGAPEFRPVHRRLSKTQSIADLRLLARRRTPPSIFDYVDGGAEEEITMRANRTVLENIRFLPNVLRDVSAIDISTSILGTRVGTPMIFGPTGFTRMMHYEGEIAVARVAVRHHIPYSLSVMGTTSVEDLAAAVPNSNNWFQLYLWKDRAASKDLLRRAQDAGYKTLVLTVDVPVAGARLRDNRNGMTMPPSLNARSIWGILRHPHWWLNALSTEPIRFASLDADVSRFMDLNDRVLDPAVTLDDVRWLRERWNGQIVVKGMLRVDDIKSVFECGVDAVVLSNHGGRQLDGAACPLSVLPEIRAELGPDKEIFVDGGIRSGADVAAAICLGANGVLIGRPYLYGLMAAGELGVERVAQLMTDGLRRTMALLGARQVSELGPHLLLD